MGYIQVQNLVMRLKIVILSKHTHESDERKIPSINFFHPNCGDGILRPAEIILPNGKKVEIINVQWRATPQGYWIYLNGKNISRKTSNRWSGEDLIVQHKKSDARFLLKNFNSCQDNILRTAIIMK